VEQFGPYEVYERLGLGGMASVHRAKKRGPAGFERTVALKRMLSHLTEDRGFVDSFVREAKVASLLAHPNIAQTYDFGRINGVFYIAMELVSGCDLRKLLRHAHRNNEPIPMPVIVSILGELCEALDYAHSFVDENGEPMHIVHRDVSPSNIIISQTGHLKVIDFGIAKANSRQLHTESGLVKGKLGYMAPEVALGLPVGPVSDIFSMGVVAWELVTTLPLFSARTDFETMRKLREEPVPAPSTHNPACPPMLDHLILAALEREPEQRLHSARAFRATLDGIAAQFGIQTSAHVVTEYTRQLPSEPKGRASTASPYAGGGDTRVTVTSRPRTSTGRQLPLPAGPETAVIRPTHPSSTLRRSDEDIQLATEIWGEDATQQPSDPGSDFSVASPHVPSSVVASFPPTPYGLHVPSLAPAHAARSHTAPPDAFPPSVVVEPARSRTPLWILAGLAIVAGTLGGILYSKRGSEPTPQVASRGHVTFVTEPEGAVVEVGGNTLGTVSPIDTELAPGVYSIAVKRDGYRTWTGSLTLREGDRQTINVALEPEPVVAAVAALPDAGSSSSNSDGPDDRDGDVDGDVAGAGDRPVDKSRRKPTGKSGKQNTATTVQTDPEPDLQKVESAKVDPPKLDPKPDPVVDKRPDPVVDRRPDPVVDNKPKTTPVVGPNVVTKLSGDVPTLRSASGQSGDVRAKLCIDEQGHVTSVKVLEAPAGISADLERALKTWRYKPYTNRDNKISPVCFPLQMRVVLRP
jgi:serine/threonine protein kinase